jgi:CO dehydrogenase maturation factor
MKICVCGKGGSGKSTVVGLMALGFRRKDKKPVVLDSDESNTSLFRMLGFEAPPLPLMDFVGGRKEVQKRMMARFSKGENEPAMSIWEIGEITRGAIPGEYAVEKDGVTLVSTGKIHQALEGCACAMGAVSREFLKKFRTGGDEILIADMEAGIEHFGRGLEAGVDGVIGVVEPSLESVSLARKVMELTQSAGSAFYGAVLNKIASGEQEQLVMKRLSESDVPVIGIIGFHESLQTACLEGTALTDGMAAPEIDALVDAVSRKGGALKV